MTAITSIETTDIQRDWDILKYQGFFHERLGSDSKQGCDRQTEVCEAIERLCAVDFKDFYARLVDYRNDVARRHDRQLDIVAKVGYALALLIAALSIINTFVYDNYLSWLYCIIALAILVGCVTLAMSVIGKFGECSFVNYLIGFMLIEKNKSADIGVIGMNMFYNELKL